ncbi:Ig-like domain-containing protein, partial [Streptococcus infantis]|uniref:Ig-like domain-containing protein n=1 Tax=Streptococcus infantis TaxID=68892 RepID=UPI0039C4077F
MYFNRKNAEQKNWRMIKKGKHFLFGCSLVFAVGASLAIQTVHADTASESTVESGSKAKEAKPGYGGEMGTYEAPAAVAETQPATVGKAVVAENTTAKTANKEALTQLVEEVKGLDKAGKTEDSLSRLNTALEQAQNVLANAEASQDQVDAAVASLKEAVAQLAAKEEKATAVATEAKAEATEDKAETAVAETEVARPRGKRDLSSRAANRSVDGSVAEGEFAGAGVKQFQSVRYSVDGDRTTWTISVVPQHKNHQAAGLVVASDDTIQSITVVDRGPNAGRLNEDYYVEKDFGKLPAMSNHKALASHYKYIGGGVPDSLTYSVVTKGTRHNLFARFATAIVKNSLENGGMNGSSAVKNRTSDFPEVGINLSSRLAPQPGVNNTYTQTNDTITVPTIASTDTVLTGTGTPGARINIKSEGKTVNDSTVVGQNGQWSFPITIGLNSNVTGGAQLVPGSQISVSQTVGGVESAATPVNVSLGHSEIVPSSKSKQQNNLVENDRNVTLKVPHDAGAAYFQFTDADGNAREVVLKRDAVPGNWQVTNSALASVASSEQGKFYSTINLTLNKDMKAGTTAKVISNMQEGSYSSLQGWQSRNVEEAPKEETPAPQPQPEPSKPNTPAVDSATTAPASAPEIVNNLAGKASTPADVTVKAPAGSTVKLYNKDGVVIGEAVANDQGVATVHPTNSLPEGEITATTTPAGGTESAKSAPITVTKTPLTEGKVSQQSNGSLVLIVSKNLVTVYPGDKIDIDVWADGTPSLEKFDAYQNPTGVAGVFPQGHFFATAGSNTWRNKKNKYIGTVAETQKAGTVDVGFVARNKKGNQFTDVIRVVVLETAKKYEPVAGTKVDVADPNNVSEDEKTKIIDSVKTANPSLPANATYSVDDKGNLTITYPDKSTDKVAAAYLVNAVDKTAPDKPVVNTDLTGKAGTKTPVEVTAEKGSTVALYDKDNNKIGEATAGENGKATITPKVDIPAGPVTAKATDAAGNTSVASDPKVATVSDTVRPVLNIPYDDADNQAIYVYSGETNNIELKVTDNSGKIVKAYLAMPADNRQGLGTEDTSYLGGGSRAALYLKADRIKTETEATETNPAVIHVTGEVPANTYTEQNGQFTRYLFAEDAAGNTAYEHVGAPMEKGALGRIRFMWKPQTFKYTATAPTTPLVGDNAPTAAELEQAVKSANPTFSDKIKTVAVNGDKVIVTYNDGSTDELPKDSVFKIRPAAPVVTPTIPATANNMPGAGVSSTDKTISGTGTPGATVTIKSGDNTLVENVPVGADGTWTATLPKGLNSNITTQPQLTPKDKVTVTQTLNGVPSAETEVPVGLGETTIQPDEKSSDKQSLIEVTKTITVKVPHDAGMAYLGYTNKDTNKAGEVALKRDSIDGPWYAKDESKAVVKSYATDGFTDTIVLEMKEPVKEGKAKAIANIVEGKYSSPVGWKEINVEAKQPTDADKNTPTAKEQTVNKGETPDAKKSIGNVDDLPKGTTVEFKTPV